MKLRDLLYQGQCISLHSHVAKESTLLDGIEMAHGWDVEEGLGDPKCQMLLGEPSRSLGGQTASTLRKE